jgi:serine/threonine-protein kinase HipA
MAALTLEVRLEQYPEPVGQLSSTSDGGISFYYAEEYVAQADKLPLSLSLPLQAKRFGDPTTRAFFDNLLPENDQLRQVMDRERLSRTDIVGLLFYLGADCPGAISCLPTGNAPGKVPGSLLTDYDALDSAVLSDVVARLADQRPLPNEMRDPSPIAGVQQKIAITLLPDGRFAVPKSHSRVPTTHILKVPRRGSGREAVLEAAAAQLGSAVGLEVAIPAVLSVGGVGALLIKRFDRQVENGTVRRVHQEDFAQAIGLPASLKYQRKATGAERFDVAAICRLLDKTAEPAASKRMFLSATFFNMIIGNNDNHAKNHALLYDGGATPRMAPLYDLLPTRLDRSVTHDFSFNIGNAERLEDLRRADVVSLLSSFGLSGAAQSRFIVEVLAPIISDADEASRTLTSQGLKDFDDLIGREASRLIDELAIDVEIRRRDYFSLSQSGWGMPS